MVEESTVPRALPHDIQAEMGVLGSMILSPDAVYLGREKLEEESFYKLAHQQIFSALLHVSDAHSAVDIILLRDELKKRGALEKIGGAGYLRELVDAVPTSANVEYYINIVREHSLRRHLGRASIKIQNLAQQDGHDVDDLLDEAETEVLGVRHMKESSRVRGMDVVLQGVLERLDTLHQNPGQLTGISYGFTDMNKLTNGLQPGEFGVIAARPSVGKTTFALNMLQHICHVERRPAVFYSLEMSAEQIVSNLLCIHINRARGHHHRVDTLDFRRGTLNDAQWEALEQSIDDLAGLPLYIDDSPSLRIGDLRARARRMHQQNGIELIVVDYLQLLRPPRSKDNRAVEVAEISAGLKALARELNVPVLSVAQLNRSVEKEERRPRMSDLRESGAIEQDADIIMLLHRPPQEEEGGGYERDGYTDQGGADDHDGIPASKAEMIVAKQRNGPVGVCHLNFWRRFLRFEASADRS